jgi:hypothetical protein
MTTAAQVEDLLDKISATTGVRDVNFHARIGTSGGISAEKCHPYPLTADEGHLNRTSYKGHAPVVFHNGVFSIDIDEGLNDSQTFVKNMLYPLHRAVPQGLAAGKYDDLIEMAVKGSRLVIMYPDGIRAYGVGWQEEPEAWYSNTGYKPARVYDWDWDDYDRSWGGYGSSYDADWWKDYKEWQKSDSKLTFRDWRYRKYNGKEAKGGES